jgi:glycosyltransferase involved in cell wall biosynthesis
LVFDVRANHDTGVSRYGLSLLPAAAADLVDQGWQVDVVASSVQRDRAHRGIADLGHHARLHVTASDDGFVRRSNVVRALARDADLYYTSHYLLDRFCPAPFIVTIHDLTRLQWPGLSYTDTSFAARFGASELRMVQRELAGLAAWQDPRFARQDTFTRYFAALNRFLVARAERVVTVSQSTGDELRQCLDVPPGRIDIVPGGVDSTVFHSRPATEIEAIRARLGIPGPYLLFVGLVHPHKRLDWLVEHLVTARSRMPSTARLVAVGGHAEKFDAVHRQLVQHQATDFVVFAGRVSDAQLAALYSGATALVSASISEGYGLPVQEALGCRCEVIAADIPVIRETAARSVHRFPPASGRALVDLSCAALAGRLERRSAAHRPPSWRSAGRELARVLVRAWRYSSLQDERIRA